MKKYEATGSIRRQVGSGRPSKVTAEIKEIVERQMRTDDETTAYQLHRLLTDKGYTISLRTILHCRTALGWTFRGSAYCQLIREANKAKRLAWAQEHDDDSFEDVIWTDECTVQMESHRRFACRKLGEAPRPKPRYICKIIKSVLHYSYYYCTCTLYLCKGVSTQLRSTFGQGLVRGEEQECVHLKGQ